MKMWAGLECTLNRVQDKWINQEDKNGHGKRFKEDFKLFSNLGVEKIRYPCLWELVAPDEPNVFNWKMLDERLKEIKTSNFSIIATFLHHGSGPAYTNLVDDNFPEKLEKYSHAFAERYPWVNDFTPINEINTTTRFSLLYGHWYPHHVDDHRGYIRSLFLQCKATILSMRAIRKFNPNAKLVQTDDLGRCQSTEPLKARAEFENHRRWISWDMLCGFIDEKHPLYSYLKESGLADEEMHWLKENKCPPDVIGVNHYLLSNRFLDHHIEKHPKEFHMQSDGFPVYADRGAVDLDESIDLPSPESLILETWERYKIPVAITEVHVMGDRTTQMKWLYDVWCDAKRAESKGAQVVAVTVWSLLGTYDWHKLCTVCELFYEPGVFDLRSPQSIPRETGLGKLVQELAQEGDSSHPILQSPGWWKKKVRSLEGRPVLITGATGRLGKAFVRALQEKRIPYISFTRHEMDITNLDQVRQKVNEVLPWAVINAAGFVKVDLAENETQKCYEVNVHGPLNLALACNELEIPLVHFSSNMVFDGSNPEPYGESDQISPLNVYGKSKAESERVVLKVHPSSLIIRSSSFFGPWDEKNFVSHTLSELMANKTVIAPEDMKISPTYLPDLVDASLDLLLDKATGVVHLSNKGQVSMAEFADLTAKMAKCMFKIPDKKIISRKSVEMNFRARRPLNSSLKSQRYEVLPILENALERYLCTLQDRV
jgi:dTDP-4-dehydrorhamnose reductase